MKNNILRNKIAIRFISVSTAMMLAAGSIAGCGLSGDDKDVEIIKEIQQDEEVNSLQNLMENQAGINHTTSGELTKEEIVYVLADANGNKQDVIVSDWIKNVNADEKLCDVSNLTDIQNVSGDEEFTIDDNKNITWNAGGNDIHYQGKTDAELPVDVHVTYYLDGAEITPEELAGKSGRVTIRFDYTNKEKKTVEIAGEEKEIYVPFTMMSGVMLDNEHFSNIEVTNGRVVSTGNTYIVIGMAFPGLSDSLDIESLKEKLDDEEAKDKLDESKIPNYVEISADAVDFKMSQTMTMAFSDVLSSLNFDSEIDIKTNEINDSMDELSDASEQLANGTDSLNRGAAQLMDGAKTLSEKSVELDEGANKLNDGANDLVEGANQLNYGAGTLLSGINQVDSGVSSLYDGANKLNKGAGDLKAGADQLAAGTAKLAAGAPTLSAGTQELYNGLGQVQGGIEQLYLLAETTYYASTHSGNYYKPEAVAKLAPKYAGLSLNDSSSDISELGDELENISATLSEDLNGYKELIAEYGTLLEEKQAVIDSDLETINSLMLNPTSTTYDVITDSYEKSGEYTYNQTVNTTNNYYKAAEEGGEDELIDTNTSTSEEEKTGTYTYTEYDTDEVTVSSYDMDGLANAIEQYSVDYEEYSEIKASYYAYSAMVEYLESFSTELDSLNTSLNEIQTYDAATPNPAQIAEKLTAGLYGLYVNMSGKIVPGANSLNEGAKTAADGINQVNAGAGKLAKGANDLKDGTDSLADGTSILKYGTGKLASGASELKYGTGKLYDGTLTLKGGTADLVDGTAQFVDGTKELYDGTLTLTDGTKELMDGMFKFKEEGIDELTSLFGDNVSGVVDTIHAIMDAGKDYKIFSDVNSDIDSSVKFIYKTDAIN